MADRLNYKEILLTVVVLLLFGKVSGNPNNNTWPAPHRKYDHRPDSDPYCKAGVLPFCPTGIKPNFMPKFGDNDTLFVYAMKAPVWEFKFGSLLKKFHIMHDAIGFHHVQSGLNLTMEWYELFELFNCTFPHEPVTNKLLWCNQGATCAYGGIDEKHWRQNGTLVKVADISGKTFNQFAEWTETDNNTYPYYETWTVKESPGDTSKIWFNPFDCASWVLRAFMKMHEFGAQFNQSVHLNYTKIELFSKTPTYIGNDTTIFGEKGNPELAKELYNFYSAFQKYDSIPAILEHLLEFAAKFLVDKNFYLYYNSEYWKLPLQFPYIDLTYNKVPLPS